ncbi:hypothetical protein MJH12_10625, partial [bacterium]|nr:hypothetical protein [bacterium]
MKKFIKSKWIIIPALMIGFLILFNAASNKKKLKATLSKEYSLNARVIKVTQSQILPIIESYGEVKSARIWKVYSEVAGRISNIHPQLQSGYILDQGETLFQIDTSSLKLKQKEHYAQIQNIEAQLNQKLVEKRNVLNNLDLENQQLKIDQKELSRMQKLVAEQTSPDSSIDTQMKLFLNRKQKIQSLQNELNLYPSKIKQLQAQLKVQEFRHSQVLIDIEKATIKLPFRARIGKVDLYKNSYVKAYTNLFEAH